MAEIVCVDGSRLGVYPVPVLDRRREPYEFTLRLTHDGEFYGVVGEHCGYFLAGVHDRLVSARSGRSAESARWAPSDRFPASAAETGVRGWADARGLDPDAFWAALSRHLPRERELFAFRRRDPDYPAATGELRCTVRTDKAWEPERGGSDVAGERVAGGPRVGSGGRWRLARRAVLDAWGDTGSGTRAVLDSDQFAAFLGALVDEMAALVAAVDAGVAPAGGARATGGAVAATVPAPIG